MISLPLTIAHSARFVNSAALDAARAVWYTEAMDKKLRPVISIRIFRETKCFGPGVAELLRHVREAHSLRGAAMTMGDRKSTRLNSSHIQKSRMPSSA